MKKDDTPILYQEHPQLPLRNGLAVQHENTTESALAIVEWLASKGVTAWATPKGNSRGQAALVRIDLEFESLTVFPKDWILFRSPINVEVFTDHDFDSNFHDASKPWAFPFHEEN